MGRFGEMHDGRVLAGRQATTANQIGVKVPGEGLDDPHECPPKGFLRWSERSEAGHGLRITCMVKELREHGPSTRRNRAARTGRRAVDPTIWPADYTCLPTQGASTYCDPDVEKRVAGSSHSGESDPPS